jgi:hypothetical protein
MQGINFAETQFFAYKNSHLPSAGSVGKNKILTRNLVAVGEAGPVHPCDVN